MVKRVILEVKDSSRFFYDKTKYSSVEAWENSNYAGNKMVMPIETKKGICTDYMLNDLNRFFNINGRIER